MDCGASFLNHHKIPGSARHVPGRKYRKRDMACRNSWWVGKKWTEMKWNAWNEWIDMNQLAWMNWNEGIETHEMKCRNWNEWIELNEWHEWIEMNELTSMNWNEWLETNKLKRMNWNERIEMKQLIRMSWTEWMKWLTLACMNWHKQVGKNTSAFSDSMWSTTWWRYVVDIWHGALATVSCTFCRQLSRSRRPRQQRPSSGGRRRPPRKKHRVLPPESVFSAVNSRVPDRSHFPTTWWWYDWHDDVVGMLVRQLAVRIVRNSEVS